MPSNSILLEQTKVDLQVTVTSLTSLMAYNVVPYTTKAAISLSMGKQASGLLGV